ncbi:MAG: hypothetical protein K0R99_1285 [Microbacterium sp.]|uniref:hypothetical protein n=1 Tax=Microbacterium sp. TaxID=51671 RepID=UPI0026059620|nr:hypothetical protein [Microbacterium sp.]MDF2559839.1 hypothetical protein [Microbacterium sp.]
MSARSILIRVPLEQSTAWSRDSLDQGSLLCRLVAERLEGPEVSAFAIARHDRDDSESGDFSHSAGIADADRTLTEVIRQLATEFSGILVVDDDLARRGDPGLEGASFVDDRVVRHADLASEPEVLTRLLRMGASGYPLNAFLCSGMVRGAPSPSTGSLADSEVAALTAAVRIIVHAIHDAESFLLLAMDDGARAGLEAIARPGVQSA